MFAFLTIFTAGLSGYAQMPLISWPVFALLLASISWAQHSVFIRRGLDGGHGDIIGETLGSSLVNAVIATGLSYGFGLAVRALSGL
jgi:hypothetical protein